MTVNGSSLKDPLSDLKGEMETKDQMVIRLTPQEQRQLERLNQRVEEQARNAQETMGLLEERSATLALQNSRITHLERRTEEMQEQQGQQAERIEVLGRRVNQAEGRVRQLERRQRILEVVVCGCAIVLIVVVLILL